MDEDYDSVEYDTKTDSCFDDYCLSSSSEPESKSENQTKTVYDELAEKEQALLLAAQFGKNLIDEKEELERHIECLKREHQQRIESFEQESFELKRQIESLKNEYETKIYELTEDLQILGRELQQKVRHSASLDMHKQFQYEQGELMRDLESKNQQLVEELKNLKIQNTLMYETNISLEKKCVEKEKLLSDNVKLVNSFQKEIARLANKQQELEYIFLQTCNERDDKNKYIEELSGKYYMLESDKNELENILFQRETELYGLKRQHKEVVFKLEQQQLSFRKQRRSNISSSSSSSNYHHVRLYRNKRNDDAKQSSISNNESDVNNSKTIVEEEHNVQKPCNVEDIECDEDDEPTANLEHSALSMSSIISNNETAGINWFQEVQKLEGEMLQQDESSSSSTCMSNSSISAPTFFNFNDVEVD